MTIVSATLLLYTSQLAQALNHPTHCRTTKSLSDYVLSGHTYKTTTGVTFERCTFNCEMDERCLSINYLPSTRICEYNNQTLELGSLNMVRREEWFYTSSAVRGPACNGPCALVTGSLQSGWNCGSGNSATVVNESKSTSVQPPYRSSFYKKEDSNSYRNNNDNDNVLRSISLEEPSHHVHPNDIKILDRETVYIRAYRPTLNQDVCVCVGGGGGDGFSCLISEIT